MLLRGRSTSLHCELALGEERGGRQEIVLDLLQFLRLIEEENCSSVSLTHYVGNSTHIHSKIDDPL